MKKISFALFLCALISCAGNQHGAGPDPRGRMIGFIGNDALRIEAEGMHSGVGAPETRKHEARTRAVDAAKQYLAEIYSGRVMSEGCGYQPSSAQRFMGIVENGTVVGETFSRGGRCTIVYEIRSRDLREMLQGAVSAP